MRTINDNHMIYGSEIWSATDMTDILDHFLPFYLANNSENPDFEKKKHLEILSFHQ